MSVSSKVMVFPLQVGKPLRDLAGTVTQKAGVSNTRQGGILRKTPSGITGGLPPVGALGSAACVGAGGTLQTAQEGLTRLDQLSAPP